jgi:predicted permease
VALNTNLPLAQSDLPHQKEIVLEGQSPDQRTTNPFVNVQTVSEGYFETLGIRLAEGRTFQPTDDLQTVRVAVISRSLAQRLWPGRSAVGRRFRVAQEQAEQRWFTVIGVVADVKSSDLIRDENYDTYLSLRQVRDGWTYFAVKTATDPHSIAEAAAQAIWAVDPDQAVYDVMTLEERLMGVLWQRRAVAMLFGVFAVLAVFLAAAGIYGVVSHAVQRQTREIGIRLALGAAPRQVLWQVLREGLQLALFGIGVGLVCSWALVRTAVSLIHGVSPFDPFTFAAVSLLLVAVTLAATLHPVRSAMRVAPMVSLRHE